MLRFLLSAVALAGVLATASFTFADSSLALTSDHAQAAAAPIEQPSLSAPAQATASDAQAPSGFGWG